MRERRFRWRWLGLVALVLALGAVVPIASSASPTPGRNQAEAQSEATRLLGLIQLPSNAQPSAGEPSGDHGVLAGAGFDEATPNLADAHAWWTVPGQGNDVLAYVAAHLPSDAKLFVTGSGNAAPGDEARVFMLPGIADVLSQRLLAVTVVQLNANTVGVRTDGLAVWIVPRPGWERVPSAVRSIVFSARGQTLSGRAGPASTPLTVRGSRARRLVAFINRLGIVQPGVRSCPLGVFGFVTFRFLGGRGQTLAGAVEHPSGCASVSLAVGGRAGPALTDSPSVTVELERIGAVPVCSASQLQASATPPVHYRSGRELTFSFLNQSRSVCRLLGFPGVALFDAQGNRLPAVLRDQGVSSVRQQGLNAAVTLDPEQTASFSVSWDACSAPVAAQAAVTLPGLARRFTLATGSPTRPFAPCHGGLDVGALSRAF